MKHLTSPPLKTVLLVDTLDHSRIALKWFLGNFGYVVDSVRSGEEALAVFDPSIHDLVVTDNQMTGMNGAEMAHVIKMRSPVTPVVMYATTIPQDRSCLDSAVGKLSSPVQDHMLLLKEAMDKLLSVAIE